MTTILRISQKRTALKLPGFSLLFVVLFGVIFLSNIGIVFAETCYNAFGDPYTCGDDPGDGTSPLPDQPGPGDGGAGGGGTGNPAPPPTPQPPIIIGDGFLNSLYGFIVIFGGMLVSWIGKLLNWAVTDFVIGFGDVYLTWGVGVAVENGWKIIRDILNISFIFGIVYIGIRLIFDADDSSAKRSLGYLLAAALLINFSLFISKFVIDFSNSLAAVIYNTGLKTASADLSASFINLLGLSTVVNNGSGTLDVGSSVSGGLAIVFGTFIFMLMAAYALAAGAFLIIVRGIALIFFMIFSPVMFLGWIFPQFKNFTSKYWSLFLSNAFMAPAYLFCIYLTFMIMDGFKYQIRTTGQGNMGSLFSQSYTGNVNALVVFTLAIGMMLASISIAKRMGAFGGGLVVSVGNSMRKSGQGWVGRNTVGIAASKLGSVNDKLEGTRSGRNFKRLITAASLGTFDERTRRELVKKGKGAKFGSSYSYEDNKKFATEVGTTRAQGALETVIKKGLSPSATNEDKIAFERAVSGASQPQLTSLFSKYKKGTREYEQIVRAMSHDQVKKLTEAKDEEFSPNDRAALAKARGIQVKNRLTSLPPGSTGTPPTLAQGIAKASAEDLMALGFDELALNARHITSDRMDDLKKKMTPTEFALLNTDRENQLWTDFSTPATLRSVFAGKKDSEIARLPKRILTDPRSTTSLNQRVLEIILRENYLDATERSIVKGNITGAVGGGSVPQMQLFLRTSPIGQAF